MSRRLPDEPLLPQIVSTMLKIFAWMLFGLFLIGILSGVLGFLPLYTVLFAPAINFLWKFALMLLCLTGITAMVCSVR
jgi:hypothetical protein